MEGGVDGAATGADAHILQLAVQYDNRGSSYINSMHEQRRGYLLRRSNKYVPLCPYTGGRIAGRLITPLERPVEV